MLETVDVGTQNLDLYELTSEKAQMAKLKRVRRTSLLGTWVNKSHKKRKGSAPNQVATALSRARRKTRTALLTATPARSQTNPRRRERPRSRTPTATTPRGRVPPSRPGGARRGRGRATQALARRIPAAPTAGKAVPPLPFPPSDAILRVPANHDHGSVRASQCLLGDAADECVLQPAHAFGAQEDGISPNLLGHGEDRLLGPAEDHQLLRLHALLLRQRSHFARRLPALLREHLHELPVVDARMQQEVLVDDVKDEEFSPDTTGQPHSVLAGPQGDLRPIRGYERRPSFPGSGLCALENPGLRGRVRFGGDEDRSLVSPSTRSSTFPTITRPARPRTFD